MMSRHITLDDIQDYIEGRLVPADEGRVEGYLRDNPLEAARVEALRSQAVRLRKLGEEILSEPVPQAFLDILQRLQQE
jgi:anti-sigma factor RsiW